MPKQVKKAVTKKPAVVMAQPIGPTVPENSVVEVDSKGVGEVVEGPAPAGLTPVEDKPVLTVQEMEALTEASVPVPTSRELEHAELARMAARIAELEDANKKLEAQPQPAAQGQIVARKNPGEDITQRTSGGNMRVTHDPSKQLREEMATQEVKAV